MRRNTSLLGCSLGLLSACGEPASTSRSEEAAAPLGRTTPSYAAEYFVVLTGPAAVKSLPAGVDVRTGAGADATRKRLLEIEAEQAALEPLIAAEGGRVVARLTRLANVLQVAADDATALRLAKLPGVARVERVPVLERSLLSAVPTVGAPAVWAQVPGLKGEGIRIGIVDSGIDYTHADFSGAGTSAAYQANDPTVLEPGSFPTSKVVGGFDFVGDAYNPGLGVGASPDPDPLDCTTLVGEQISGGHGTHVAGIAAGTGVTAAGATFLGPYEATIDPSAFRVGPGVAPLASLYALKIFGCEGATTFLTSALDRAADPNDDGSFDDRLDVVNGSLGSSFALGSQVTGDMISELAAVGTLVVAAAGNDGQSFFAVGSPASFPEVLSVGASVDNDLVNLRVTAPASAVAAYPAAEAMFTASLVSTGPITAPLVASDPPLGCEPFLNAAAMPGAIALVDRGVCPFIDKFANAVAAGAIGVVIVNNEPAQLPFAMSGPPGTSPVLGVMVTQADGAALVAALATGPLTVSLDPADPYTGPGAELLAGFSSRGPSAIDGRLKPEISAPGAAIDSAGVGTGTEPIPNQGTSMASPVVAGAAALVRQAKPELGPLEVKALLMNAAVPLADFSGNAYTTTVIGAGRVDVARAVESTFTAAFDAASGEVGISFGSTTASTPQTIVRDFELENHGATAETVTLDVEPTFSLPGVVVSVAPAEIDVGPGATATATLTLSFDPALLGDAGPDPGTPAVQGQQSPQARHFLNQATGRVRMAWATGDAVLPYTGSVRAASAERVVQPSACNEPPAPGEPVTLAREGEGAHPAPVITAFQLAAADDADPRSASDPNVAMTDLRAVGVATNLATAETFADAFAYFGVAVEGPWSTPARGPLSVLTLRIDADGLMGDDFEIRVEARNPDGPFRDALVASPYSLPTGERGERIPVNVVLPDVAHTYPFNSTVLVIPVNLAALGLDDASPAFDWRIGAERPDLLVVGADSLEGRFDANALLLDTARFGLDGTPLFLPGEPLTVDLAPGALTSGDPLEVLLLEHTNAPGQQWEIVSLAPKAPGNLSLAAAGPATIAASESAQIVFTVTNGSAPASNVQVTGTVSGGEIVSVTTSAGTCAAGAISCSLGDLAVGATAEVKATVRGAAGATISLEGSATSELGCESDEADNAASYVVAIQGQSDDPSPEPVAVGYSPSGGCDCAIDRGTPRLGGGAWLVVAGAMAARWRRRSRRAPAARSSSR